MKCCCVECGKEYTARGIHTHYERSHGTPDQRAKYSSGFNGKYDNVGYRQQIKERKAIYFNETLGEVKRFHVRCYHCDNDMYVDERESKFPSKDKYFCSRSCANTRTISDSHKLRTKVTLLRKLRDSVKCATCGAEYTPINTRNKKFCTDSCKAKHEKNHKKSATDMSLNDYRRACQFKFNLSDYPTEFNFELVTEHGWYSPTNKKNNIRGVSRDHIISVRYGYDNKIDPKIISHPANCQLLLHSDNVSKYTKNGLTLMELEDKINKWNSKYGI
jgi:hypothetical protein